MDEGKAGFKLKTAWYFKTGDLVAGIVFFYSIAIDIQNHFQSNKDSSQVKNCIVNAWS